MRLVAVARWTVRASAAAGVSALAWACAPAGPPSAVDREQAAPTAESAGYAAPPTLISAERTGRGTAVIGRAQARARVRIAAPDGWATEVASGAGGVWRATLPGAPGPRMYALSATEEGREVRAEGPLVSLPAPGPPALLVRAGYAALALPARVARPIIVAVDFDAVGSAAVGGVAPPNTRVQLSVDGQPADVDLTDAGGRFALVGPRNRPLPPGPHSFSVAGGAGADTVTAQLTPPASFGGVFTAGRTIEGWRLDWSVPGGGVQSTLALDAPRKSAP